MKKILTTLICVLLFSKAASARIEILIDASADKKFPIAVPAFVTEKGGKAGGTASKMAELIRKDLLIAGLFQIVDDRSLPQADRDVTDIKFEKWRALEVGGLVKGVVGKGGIQIRLYDVAGGKMLMGKQYSVSGKNWIDASHRFVDSLMESLTGFRGPFESRIAASCGKPFKRSIAWFEMDAMRSGGLAKGVNAISPAFSPDGSRVAYTAFNSRYPEVYVNGRQVTNFRSTTITPVFTPGGRSLVVATAKSGDTELYEVGMGGGVIRQLTRSTNIDLSASFAPDGQFVFASERAGGLHLFNSNGARLTFVGYQNDQPDWSPDGSKIVFASRDRGAFDIFMMDADGSNIMRLTRDEGNNESPSWAPDSRYIVFQSSRGGLYTMLDDGTAQTLIPKTGGCINPEWGPWLSKGDK